MSLPRRATSRNNLRSGASRPTPTIPGDQGPPPGTTTPPTPNADQTQSTQANSALANQSPLPPARNNLDTTRRRLARELFMDGATAEEVQAETGLSPQSVMGIKDWLESVQSKWYREQRQGVTTATPAAAHTPATPPAPRRRVNIDGTVIETTADALGDGNEVTVEERFEGPAIVGERSTEIPSEGADKKSKLSVTPKVLLWYEFSRKKGYNGTLTEYIDEAVDGYYALKGYRLAVTQSVN